tara:strand:- start:538 stop:966 length:429 start_codon:yes stop_codon:yes gene_type:complete
MFDLREIPQGLPENQRNAYSSATARLSHIMDLHASYLEYEEDDDLERIEDEVREMPLSVEVRSDWYSQLTTAIPTPSEFRILLSTGGPAVQIVGEISHHGEPECIKIQYQDWFLPWKALPIFDDNRVAKALDWFCSRFYFGE